MGGSEASVHAGAGTGRQFLRFALVGTFGFLVDAGVLRLALWAGLGFYGGRVVSFLAAATFTWFCNRHYTFARRDRGPPGELLAYLGLMLGGGAVNYAVYALTIETVPLARQWPEIGVGLGAIAGLAVNFLLARRLISRDRPR